MAALSSRVALGLCVALVCCTATASDALHKARYYETRELRSPDCDEEETLDVSLVNVAAVAWVNYSQSHHVHALTAKSRSFDTDQVTVTVSLEVQARFYARLEAAGMVRLLKEPRGESKAGDPHESLLMDWGEKETYTTQFNASPRRRAVRAEFEDFAKTLKGLPGARVSHRTTVMMGDDQPAAPTTFDEILANPDQFDGHRVRFDAFLHLQFEDFALWPDQAVFAGHKKFDRSIWMGEPLPGFKGPKPSPRDAQVTIEGTFECGSAEHGHLGLWPGSLNRATSIEPIASSR